MHDKIVHLQTNYQVNPLGIELKDIVFSWKQTQNYEKEIIAYFGINALHVRFVKKIPMTQALKNRE